MSTMRAFGKEKRPKSVSAAQLKKRKKRSQSLVRGERGGVAKVKAGSNQ